MITADILKFQLNTASYSLPPGARWKAFRWFNTDLWKEDEFIFICGIMLCILILLFIIVTLLAAIKRKRISNRLFIDYADKTGLSIRERQILMDIAVRAKLRLAESIFSMGDVFDRGATQMMRVTLAKHGSRRSRYLSAELSVLREKLGFRRRIPAADLTMKQGRPGSRQIPEGRKLYLTNPETIEFLEAETVIIENTELKLTVRMTDDIVCEQGDSFCARYYFGSLIWEFDTFVLRTKDNNLILQHSDNIRYVNRRRFLRVAVNEPAYIAAFPFARDLMDNEKTKRKNDLKSEVCSIWEPPKFIPADLVELAGPGLRLVSPIEVKVGDRVVVILKLGRKILQDSGYSDFTQNNNTEFFRIIEDVGIVKHTEKAEKGFSIAVELTGLSDKNISEMVRATNEASLGRRQIKDIPPAHKAKPGKWEYISETIVN